MRNILFAAAECGPFIKTGGLGSVLSSLPGKMDRTRNDVRVVIPAYECISREYKEQMQTEFSFPMDLGWREFVVTIKSLKYKGITYYFVENPYYFCGDYPYGDISADVEKFTFFGKAVLEMTAYMEYQPDLIHCHDWQSAMIPVFLKGTYGHDPFYSRIKTVLTIHNLKFQGWSDIGRMKDISGLPDWFFGYEWLESYGQANMLKGGIICADQVTTVSETYAEEILTPEFGEGLDGALRYRKEDLTGIVNGIDYEEYDPAHDPFLEVCYDIKDRIPARKSNKLALQKKTGLVQDEEIFTLGIVSRLTDQKGFDLFSDIMDELMGNRIQLYVLGGGQREYEDLFDSFRDRYPDQIYLNTVYSDEMAKMIYGGCDAVLMPSRFEPCGLCQLMSLRYGAVPIVRQTGGLADTVIPAGRGEKKPTGFAFRDYEPRAFYEVIMSAMLLYHSDRKKWNAMVERGMRQDYSWKKSCAQYEKVYDRLVIS